MQALRVSSTAPAAAELCATAATWGTGLFAAPSAAVAEIGKVAEMENRPRPMRTLYGAEDDGQFMMVFSSSESLVDRRPVVGAQDQA